MATLTHVRIENFKSIRSASVSIKPGFTVLVGPNGSGKSCFLESIAFGLGANPQSLRVSVLKNLINESNSISSKTESLRVLVLLTFQTNDFLPNSNCHKNTKEVIVGSTIINNQRLYMINSSKVSKEKFVTFIKEKLHFAHQSQWNIAQKSVQNIINATPSSLFDIICYAAGTHLILEAKNQAIAQAEKSRQQLVNVKQLIDQLQQEVCDDQVLADRIRAFHQVSGTTAAFAATAAAAFIAVVSVFIIIVTVTTTATAADCVTVTAEWLATTILTRHIGHTTVLPYLLYYTTLS